MKETLLSYNVNGIRAAERKGLWEFLRKADPDVIMFQEIKATPDDLAEEMKNPHGYHAIWHPAEKKGYSGVALLSKRKPSHVEVGCGIEKYDREGRIIRADFPEYSAMCVYFPSGTTGEERQTFKEEFLADFFTYIKKLSKKFPRLIISGDINIAHTEDDIHNPVSNKNSSGFLPQEREWMTKFLSSGFKDAFRLFRQGNGHYTWWTFRANARANNKGWRIDYHFVSEGIAKNCTGYRIYSEIVHSDHCPIALSVEF